MKIILILIFSTFLIISQNHDITEGLAFKTDLPIDSYMVFNNNSQNFLSVFTSQKNQNKWLVFDSSGKQVSVEENTEGDYQTLYKDQIFFLGKALNSFSISDFKITNYKIPNNDYRSFILAEYENQTLFIACNKSRVDIYDTKDGKFVNKILFDEEMKIPRIMYHKDRIVYKHKVNGITVFDLKENKTLWKYDTGSDGMYMLGIKVGTLSNEISRFLIDEDKDSFLIMNTWFGYLYKFDFNSGKVLLEKKRFKGTGNNAGLINTFDLIDMNKDGVKDIVAGSVDNNVYCINGKDFSVMWEYDTDNEIQLPLSLYDINGDKIPEVFVVNDYDNVLFILDGKNGKLIREKNIKDWEKLNQTSVILVDFNGNGKLDLIVKRNPRKLQLYEMKDIQIPKNSIVWDLNK